MAEARCLFCGRRFVRRTGSHVYCDPVCRERARAKDFSRRMRYSSGHQRLRRAWARKVATGTVRCARCGELISPREPWDLDHLDERPNGERAPSHRACNRATAKGQPTIREDDPENGIYWSPPDEHGVQHRWSRPWFAWREDPKLNPPWLGFREGS